MKPAPPDTLVTWFETLLPSWRGRLQQALLQKVAVALRGLTDLPNHGSWTPADEDTARLLAGLTGMLAALTGDADRAAERFEEFTRQFFAADSPRESRRLAADHLRETVSDARQLKGDLRALRRDLDHDALRERHLRFLHDRGQQMLITLEVITGLMERTWQQEPTPEGATEIATLVPLLHNLVRRTDSYLPRDEVFRTLCAVPAEGEDLARSRHLILERVADTTASVWSRRQAVAAVLRRWPETGMETVESLLTGTAAESRDGFLVRLAAVRLIPEGFSGPRGRSLLERMAQRPDPTEAVRMERVRTLRRAGFAWSQPWLSQLGAGEELADPSHRVRAAVYEELAAIAKGDAPLAVRALCRSLAAEGDPFAARVAVEEIASVMRHQLSTPAAEGGVPVGEALTALAAAARGEPAVVAFHAARELCALRPLLEPELGTRLSTLLADLDGMKPGDRKRVHIDDGGDGPAQDLYGALLAQAGGGDLGYSARDHGGSLVVQRGDRSGRSLARILHELRHRSPDKRQAGDHTTRSRAVGSLRAPALGMASITATTVPGEPVVSPVLGSWGPHLPGVGDCLDAARGGGPVRIYHPHGITVVQPPTGLRRVAAVWSLRWQFGALDAHRRRCADSVDPEEQRSFVAAIERLGFQITHEPATVRIDGENHPLGNPHLQRYFGGGAGTLAALAGLPSWTSLADQSWNYIVSTGGNSLLHLVAVVAGLGSLVLGEAVVQGIRIRRWRRSLPLVIGGWGTRGKSGTERLKTALFTALGCEVLGKTTGNEAAIVHSAPGIEPTEILLYRPYDKASIWEQRDVLQLASRMGAQVMLWECMALRPRYVEILALGWMRDDLSTITNCYPDHEDRQGPGGRDVARSISSFVPRQAALLTAEREMLPIIRERAKEQGSRCLEITDRDGEMLPRELLVRFFYEAHPSNVALVARLADELGIDREYAICSMADHVVPDMGSLKVYPEASYRGRRITYINGHSANDRTGFLTSWERVGLARYSPTAHPGQWIMGVVNNRADRMARTRVFAGILAKDVAAHGYCLIGTNLGGFVGTLRQALHEQLASFRLGHDRELALARYGRLMTRLQMPRWDGDQLTTEIEAWLRGCGLESAEVQRRLAASDFRTAVDAWFAGREFEPGDERVRRVLDRAHRSPGLVQAVQQLCDGATGEPQLDGELAVFVRRQVALYGLVAAAARAIEGAVANPTRLERRIRKLYVQLVLERVFTLDDPGASGDQVLHFLASHIPPGVRARAMGMQNIKGTGLDFVYRWESYAQVTTMLRGLEQAQPAAAVERLRQLRNHPDYGLLDARLARDVVAQLRGQRGASWAEIDGEATITEQLLAERAQARERALARGRSHIRLADRSLRLLEHLFDTLHSIYRRRAANRILDDLLHRRISHSRAAARMREITVAQRGGWLRRTKNS